MLESASASALVRVSAKAKAVVKVSAKAKAVVLRRWKM